MVSAPSRTVACALAFALTVGAPVVPGVPGEVWFDLLTAALPGVTVVDGVTRRAARHGADDGPPEPADE